MNDVTTTSCDAARSTLSILEAAGVLRVSPGVLSEVGVAALASPSSGGDPEVRRFANRPYETG